MTELSACFAQYLASSRRMDVLRTLVDHLEHSGLKLESHLMAAYGDGMASRIIAWNGQEPLIHLGTMPPEGAILGDLWFDPIEVQLCRFIPHTEDWATRSGGWFSTAPVSQWQYDGFCAAVQLEWLEKPRFPLLAKSDREEGGTIQPARNMFAYEAKVYARFFGKSLIGANLECAITQLAEKELAQLLPSGLNLWSNDFAWGREDLPIAYNRNSVMEDGFEALEVIRPAESKLIYEEWERSQFVGFACYVEATGMKSSLNPQVHPFIRLLNCPSR